MAGFGLAGRVAALRALLATRHLDALILSHLPNVRYLSGFTGTAARLIVTATSCDLVVDGRYHVQAAREAPHCRIFQVHGAEPELAVLESLAQARAQQVGFESGSMSYWEQGRLAHLAPHLGWVPAGGEVEELRMIKDADEIACLREAARATLVGLDEVLDRTRPGHSEAELAGYLEGRLRALTAEPPAFPVLVASGVRAAEIHATPSPTLIRPGDPVLIDCGATFQGYRADCCRTVWWGEPSAEALRAYTAVRAALAGAIAMVRPGVMASALDAEARRILTAHGFAEGLIHDLGHGVGLEIHEGPWIAPGEHVELVPGMVIALEPGLYRDAWGGIRLEETILVTPTGAEVLTGQQAAGRSHGVL